MDNIHKILDGYVNNKRGLMTKLRYDTHLTQEIINSTKFLNEDSSISERIYCLYNNIFEQPICLICGKQRKFEKMDKGYFSSCGDDKCKKEAHVVNTKKGCVNKDYKNIYEKAKKTNFERYGVYHTQSNESKFRISRDETMKKRYGTTHALQVKSIKNKQIETTIKNEIHITHQERIRNGIIKKYNSYDKYLEHKRKRNNKCGEEHKSIKNVTQRISELEFDINTYNDGVFNLTCKKCGNVVSKKRYAINQAYRDKINLCYTCNPYNFRSKLEEEVLSYIRTVYKKEIDINRQYLGSEVDILLVDDKIGIECNGVYWHSEIHKSVSYHRDKRDLLEQQGWHLIQIWEDDWNDKHKQQVIKNRLLTKLGIAKRIYARKCELRVVSKFDATTFLNNHHLYGYTNSTINIGLYFENELMTICTFSKGRNSMKTKNEDGYELIRNCTKGGYNVIGGFSKMIKYFIKTYGDNVYSYADCDWVNTINNAYIKTGFILEHKTKPTYWWAKNKRENRIKFQKHKLVAQGYDVNKTESEIMRERGYRKVYGSGNLKYRYKKGDS